MPVEILSKSKKEKIIEKLNENFGVADLPYLLIQTGKEKIRAFSGNLSRDELNTLFRNINIEIIGMRIAKFDNDDIRLTFDACSLFRNQISKNIIEVDDEQADLWFKGNDLDVNIEKLNIKNINSNFIVIKHNNDIFGIGKLTQNRNRILNYVPKERRRRN